jgi:hypothetical protein
MHSHAKWLPTPVGPRAGCGQRRCNMGTQPLGAIYQYFDSKDVLFHALIAAEE